MIYSLDTETYYRDSKKKGAVNYSIRGLGNWLYCHHPEFDCYMLTIAGEDGFTYAGRPESFDWKIVQNQEIVMHNAGFDLSVVGRLVELGIAPADLSFADVFDTADLAAYLGFPRSLAAAAENLLGVTLDKSVRANANGVYWSDMDPDAQEAMTAYALADATNTLQIWLKHGQRWPADERRISEITREMCATGLPVDKARVLEACSQLQELLAKVRAQIPWADDPDAKALSKKEVAIECAKHEIIPPKSMAKDSEEFDEWLRANGELMPWAKAMGQYRSINAFLKKLEVMALRTRDDGTMPFGTLYAGAHTLRDSGDSGFNVQNMAREPMFGPELVQYEVIAPTPSVEADLEKTINPLGVDMRGMVEAPEGYLLGVVDLSAIEPCSLSILSGDEELAQMLRDGMDPYEAQARIDGEYDGSEPLKNVDKYLRQYNKVKVLGCGYGAGAPKVRVIAKTQIGIELTEPQSEAVVAKFRSRKFIPDLWKALEAGMKSCGGRTFEVETPNGGSLRYRNVRSLGSLSAVIPRQGRMQRLKFWGGTLTENLVQRVARDVFMDGVLKLTKAGIFPCCRIHDEVVCLFKEDEAATKLAQAIKCMSTQPDWWPELPLRAEGFLTKRYCKG